SELWLGIAQESKVQITLGSTVMDTGLPLANDWTHLALVIRKTDNRGSHLKLLAGGVVVFEQDLSAVTWPPSSRWFIGGRGTTNGADRLCAGRFAELRLWNSERSDSEISSNMEKDLAGQEAELFGYWPLS